MQTAPVVTKNHSITVMGTDVEKLQDWVDIWRHFCAVLTWNQKESGLQDSPHDRRAECSWSSPSAYLDPWPLPAPFDPHAYDCWRFISCRRNLPVPHAPILQPTYKVDLGLTLQRLQVGNLRAGRGLHHRRGVTESSGRSSRTNWVRLSMFHDSSQPQRF